MAKKQHFQFFGNNLPQKLLRSTKLHLQSLGVIPHGMVPFPVHIKFVRLFYGQKCNFLLRNYLMAIRML